VGERASKRERYTERRIYTERAFSEDIYRKREMAKKRNGPTWL